MAGYSGTPLVAKLGIKEASRVGVLSAPSSFAATLGPLPAFASVRTGARAPLDVAICFVTVRADLVKRFPALVRAIEPNGAVWIAWPKKASKVATDVDENVVRSTGLASGVVDVKVCAIDEVWSGLKFMVRLVDRKAKAGSGGRSAKTRRHK